MSDSYLKKPAAFIPPRERHPALRMPFTAIPSFVGNPDFNVIDINPEEVAKALQLYLERGSKLTGVSLDDINTGVLSLPTDQSKETIASLLGRGMRLFDAIVWLSAGRPATHTLKVDATLTKDNIPSLHEIARSVFYAYFFLVTQARYPAGEGDKDKPRVPNFLRTVMGMDEDQTVYMKRIVSFTPQKFDPKWVKYVQFKGLGQETLSRFGLGVAGYRMFGPFKLYEPKSDVSASLSPAITFAQTVAKKSATWDIHPLTRDPSVLTKRGNLNKNLGNLILEVFSEEQIAEMVTAKILYKKPDREPSNRNYLKWTAEDDISGTSDIFRQ